jgi:2-oxoglutarate ferredoxin oxidoreductase subunit alpha
VVLTDFFLDNRVENVAVPKASEEEIADGNIYPDASEKGSYRRFADTESGISPRSIPGMEEFLFTTTGLEHTETGEPDYTSDNHMKMSEKRHRKIDGALKDLPQPREFRQHAQLDVGVIAWGSTFGSALEAVKKAQQKDLKVGALKVTSIFPYHADLIRGFMDRCAEIIIPELNFEGQLANLIGHLHRKDVLRLNQATGIPMSPNTILRKIESLI